MILESKASASFNILALTVILRISTCYKMASGALAISSTFHIAGRKEAKQGGQKECIFQLNLQPSREFHITLTCIISLNLITWPHIAERVVGKPSL